MTERISKCPQCKAAYPEIIEVLNPDTTAMNANAKIKCPDCKHEWEGKVTSQIYEKERKFGFIR